MFVQILARRLTLISIVAGTFTLPASSLASSWGEDNLLGYDAIVNELNRENDRPQLSGRSSMQAPSSSLDTVLFHGGIGMAALMQTVTFADGTQTHLNQRGIQASFGIDLFSRRWIAEGTARTFGNSEDSRQPVSLQEFELKVIHKDRLSADWGYRLGGGLSARYMNVHRAHDIETFTTPSGVATLGLDFYVTNKMSFGADINARSAMITDTPDSRSVDGTLRVDFHL